MLTPSNDKPRTQHYLSLSQSLLEEPIKSASLEQTIFEVWPYSVQLRCIWDIQQHLNQQQDSQEEWIEMDSNPFHNDVGLWTKILRTRKYLDSWNNEDEKSASPS